VSATVWLDPEVPADLELIESVWADAPVAEEERPALVLFLGSAQDQCLDYLDADLTEETVVLDSWKLALILQCRALWQSAVTDPNGRVGEGEFQVTVYPMDWTVKNLLRPKRGIPVVG
jgi:hypothetical protein